MSTSSTELLEKQKRGLEVETYLSEVMEPRPVLFEEIRGGRNSRVFKLVYKDSSTRIAKFYFGNRVDGASRLEVEFSALHFLWRRGIRCVPQPIRIDRGRQCALYQYVDGKKIEAEDVSDRDVDFAVSFLIRLKGISKETESLALPLASEAFFSLRALFSNLDWRFQNLIAASQNGKGKEALRRLLRGDFSEALQRVKERVLAGYDRLGREEAEEIPLHERTLSPSDFGFHNAVRISEGCILFLDFEYFGWDDPAKTVSDFLLHPAMPLAAPLKNRFYQSAIKALGSSEDFESRVNLLYPLFGLKWCLILLNAFLPHYVGPRGFGDQGADVEDLRARQLEKARAMLRQVVRSDDNFPYAG